MKKIVMILESGEEIVLGHATSLFKYLLNKIGYPIVPIHGNREYSLIKNIYDNKHKQFVTYKSVANE
jgi:hypothetical protein